VVEGANSVPATTKVASAANDLPDKPAKAKRKKVVVADAKEAAPEEDHPPEVVEARDAETTHAS